MLKLNTFNKSKIKTLNFYEEEGKYYAKVVGAYENESGKYEVIIPKIDLDIDTLGTVELISRPSEFAKLFSMDEHSVRIGGTRYYDLDTAVIPEISDEPVYFVERCLEETVHKLTKSEIEDKLGYKIEVIEE